MFFIKIVNILVMNVCIYSYENNLVFSYTINCWITVIKKSKSFCSWNNVYKMYEINVLEIDKL